MTLNYWKCHLEEHTDCAVLPSGLLVPAGFDQDQRQTKEQNALVTSVPAPVFNQTVCVYVCVYMGDCKSEKECW